MKTFLTVFIVLIFHTLANAQSFSPAQEKKKEFIFQQLTGEAYQDVSVTHKGIYFRENFLPGNITLTNGETIDSLQLRYNGFEDQLIWLTRQYGQIKVDKDVVREFKMRNGDTVFHFIKIQASPINQIFVQQGYNGAVKVYVQQKINPNTDYYRNGIHYFKYKPQPVYWIAAGGKIIPSGRSLNSLYQAFPDKKEAIRKQVKEMHLKYRTSEEFINLIAKLESILL